jgi:hypothetical protein
LLLAVLEKNTGATHGFWAKLGYRKVTDHQPKSQSAMVAVFMSALDTRKLFEAFQVINQRVSHTTFKALQWRFLSTVGPEQIKILVQTLEAHR